jgi:peptidylprolyl isomerase/peptidyl-prolyl cis-trans isomerase D
MGVMNNLRENTGVILWILVFSFGVIWVLQDSNVFETMNQQPRDIAVVNGAPIRYEDFQRTLEQRREQVRQQMGQQEMTPRMEEMVRDQAYNQLIQQELLQQEMKRLGITVTEQEIMDMVYGSNPHPIIRRQFADSTGQINRQLIQNLAQNPEYEQRWIQLEDFLERSRRQEKMNSLVQATIHVSAEDVEEYHQRQQAQASVRYVSMRYASVPDDSISITESDLRSYYDENKEDFKKEKTFSLEYVTLPKIATAADTAAITEDLEELRSEFEAAENDSLFLAQNASDRTFSADYQTADQMEGPIASAIFGNLEPGATVGPVYANDAAHLLKILDTEPAESKYVHARHILLRSQESDAETRRRLSAIKDSIASGAATFEQMAREYSDDGSASEGGDLGWFGRGQMVEAFEEAAFNADPGELVGPVKSNFGYHLIRVEETADRAVQFADLAYNLRPSQATLSEKENTLEDLVYFADESGNFAQEAKRMDMQVETVDVTAGQSSIPGIGESSALNQFLETAEQGDVSEIAELNDKFAVVHVTGVEPEGYRPFEEVKSEIRPRVELQKKRDVLAGQMRLALRENGFDGMASALNTRIRTQENVTYQTQSVPGIGRDPSFVGTVFGLDEGATSGVVEGENAAFVVEVTSLSVPGEITAQQRQQIRQQLLRQQQQRVAQQYIATLRDRADITDNRGAFR